MIVRRPSPNVALPTLKGFVELLESFMCVPAFQLPSILRSYYLLFLEHLEWFLEYLFNFVNQSTNLPWLFLNLGCR